MRPQRTAFRRLAAVAVIATLALMASAQCFAATRTQAERDCCAAMAGHCHGGAQGHECCRPEAPRVAQEATTARVTLPLIAPESVAVIAVVLPCDHLAAEPVGARAHSPVKPPGRPTYLLVSSLRI